VSAIAIALAGLCAACGTAERSDDATAVVERFQAALDASDGMAACAELSEETSTTLEQQEGDPCDEAILAIELPPGREVSDTSVYVTSASVSLLEGGTLFLDEASDGWEISAAGCTPTAPELPYDCELEN
jgi:hypothetical protein